MSQHEPTGHRNIRSQGIQGDRLSTVNGGRICSCTRNGAVPVSCRSTLTDPGRLVSDPVDQRSDALSAGTVACRGRRPILDIAVAGHQLAGISPRSTGRRMPRRSRPRPQCETHDSKMLRRCLWIKPNPRRAKTSVTKDAELALCIQLTLCQVGCKLRPEYHTQDPTSARHTTARLSGSWTMVNVHNVPIAGACQVSLYGPLARGPLLCPVARGTWSF